MGHNAHLKIDKHIWLSKYWLREKNHYFFMRTEWFFIWTNLNPLNPKMQCGRFGWNWSSGSWEEDFLNVSMYFCDFVIISLWKRAGPSFEQTWIPFNQGCFMQSLVEIGPVVHEEKIFFSSMYFRFFRNYLPLEMGGALHLNKFWSPSPKDALC